MMSCAVLRSATDIIVADPGDYVEAKSTPPLFIPADLDGSNIRDQWQIPIIEHQEATKVYPRGAPKPVSVVGDNDPNVIRIQKLGERRWMVVQRTPETVWPLVRQFLNYYTIDVESEQPSQGLIVTGVFDTSFPRVADLMATVVSDEVDHRQDDYAVFRIEQGIKRGTSEVHLRYLRSDETANPEIWKIETPRGSLEGKLLTALAEYDASAISETTVSSVGRQIATDPKALIVRIDSGHPVLQLKLDYDRAWASISKALRETSGVEVAEVRQADQSWLVSVSEVIGQDPTETKKVLGLFGGARVKMLDAIVKLEEFDQGYQVSLKDLDANWFDNDFSEEFLAYLREHAA